MKRYANAIKGNRFCELMKLIMKKGYDMYDACRIANYLVDNYKEPFKEVARVKPV